MQESEYQKEIKKLQEELSKERARRQEAVSNYDLLVGQMKEKNAKIKKYEEIIRNQDKSINLLNATMNDMKAGRI